MIRIYSNMKKMNFFFAAPAGGPAGGYFRQNWPKFQNMISQWVLIRLTWNFNHRFLHCIEFISQKRNFDFWFQKKIIEIFHFLAFLAYGRVYLEAYISGKKSKIKNPLLRNEFYYIQDYMVKISDWLDKFPLRNRVLKF